MLQSRQEAAALSAWHPACAKLAPSIGEPGAGASPPAAEGLSLTGEGLFSELQGLFVFDVFDVFDMSRCGQDRSKAWMEQEGAMAVQLAKDGREPSGGVTVPLA